MLFNGKNLSFCLFKASHLSDISPFYTQLLRYKMGIRRGAGVETGPHTKSCTRYDRDTLHCYCHTSDICGWRMKHLNACHLRGKESVCCWVGAVNCVSWPRVTGLGTHLEFCDGRVDQRSLGHPHVELLLLEHRRVIVHIPEPNVNLLVTRPEI